LPSDAIDNKMPTAGSVGGGDEVSLNMPRKSVHDVYLIHAMNTLSKFNQIIFTLSGPTDPRVVPYTRTCIGLIIDDNIKNSMKKALREALTYIKNTNLDVTEQGLLQMEACQSAIDEVYSYFDEFIGLSKTNAVVPVASDPTPDEVKAARDILIAGGDLEDPGVEDTDPEKAMIGSDKIETDKDVPVSSDS
jgi:hypothetical protein